MRAGVHRLVQNVDFQVVDFVAAPDAVLAGVVEDQRRGAGANVHVAQVNRRAQKVVDVTDARKAIRLVEEPVTELDAVSLAAAAAEPATDRELHASRPITSGVFGVHQLVRVVVRLKGRPGGIGVVAPHHHASYRSKPR